MLDRVRHREVALAAEGVAALIVARVTMQIMPFGRLTRLGARAERALGRSRYARDPTPNAIGLAIRRAARALPGRSTCLARGIAAMILLRRRGMGGELAIGVRRSPEGEIEAHAWVECDGAVIIGGELTGYERVRP